jgi:hypothetical protein
MLQSGNFSKGIHRPVNIHVTNYQYPTITKEQALQMNDFYKPFCLVFECQADIY